MSSAISDHYYEKLAFRPGVEYVIGATRAVFTYDLLTFDVELNEPAVVELDRLCAQLRAGLSTAGIATEFREFAPHVWQLLETFDRHGFLTEVGGPTAQQTISGTAFWKEVEAFSTRAKVKFRPVLYEALRGGAVSKASLIAYAREYYQLVKAGPQIIAGALPHAHDWDTRKILERFLRGEIGHEALLISSLESVGVGAEEIDASTPLPETFALISALQVLADQEPLSFKALVFLLEEASPEFHEAFVAACGVHGLGQSFWQPILDHAGINDDERHGSISEQLLEHVELVTVEERLVVLKHVATMVESLVAFEHAILGAHGD
jgi:hypothetical protein